MIDITGLVHCSCSAGICTSSPVAEVKRTDSESPYTNAVATNRRREIVALTMFFQIIFFLRLAEYPDGLVDRSPDCARAIAVPVERLLLTSTFSPIAWGFACQLSERGGERGLRRIAELSCNRDDRCVGIAQSAHSLFEPVLAQPRMR